MGIFCHSPISSLIVTMDKHFMVRLQPVLLMRENDYISQHTEAEQKIKVVLSFLRIIFTEKRIEI